MYMYRINDCMLPPRRNNKNDYGSGDDRRGLGVADEVDDPYPGRR